MRVIEPCAEAIAVDWQPRRLRILWNASIKSLRCRWRTYGTHSTVRAASKSRRLLANSWLPIQYGKVFSCL